MMHTKGPWKRTNDTHAGKPQIIGDTQHICTVMRNGNVSANARLIAAAPELLEDLEKIGRIAVNAGHAPSHEDALNILLDIGNLALEAIRTATGE